MVGRFATKEEMQKVQEPIMTEKKLVPIKDDKLLVIGGVIVIVIVLAVIVGIMLMNGTTDGVMTAECGDNACNGTETETSCPIDCSVAEDIPLPSGGENDVVPNFPA